MGDKSKTTIPQNDLKKLLVNNKDITYNINITFANDNKSINHTIKVRKLFLHRYWSSLYFNETQKN